MVRTLLLGVALALLVSFQNCTNVTRFKSEPQSDTQLSGNGNGYGGKPIYFENFNPSQRCPGTSVLGNPFPNRMIFATSVAVTLVRDNCQDLEPVVIPPSEYTYDATGQFIVYQGQQFNVRADLSEYNRIPALCPGNRVPNGASPANMLVSPLDLTAAPWTQENTAVSLHGSIEALPRFRVEHSGPALEAWQRVRQRVNIAAGTDYAVTFLASPGSLNLAYFVYWVDDGTGNTRYSLDINIDLLTGLVTYNNGPFQGPGITNVSIKTQRYGAGYAFTVFFRQLTSETGDVGISGTNGVFGGTMPLGSYIYATAADVKPVDAYCAP